MSFDTLQLYAISTMPNTHNENLFPESKPLSDSIFAFEPRVRPGSHRPPSVDNNIPTVIVLFSWGSALPNHVIKYIEGYRALFPMSRIVLVTGSLYRAMYYSYKTQIDAIMPVVEYIFESGTATEERILLHAMSNVGIVSYLTLLRAYQAFKDSRSEKLPYSLLVLDSTPGSAGFEPVKWATALAYEWKRYSPLPIAVMIFLYALYTGGRGLVTLLTGTRDTDFRLRAGPNNLKWATTSAPRLYLYGKKDRLISWKEVEKHIADSRRKGFKCETELFENSDHVSHMRKEPERYWGAISSAWKDVVKSKI